MDIKVIASFAIAGILLSSCTLGPNFTVPDMPSPASWFRNAPAEQLSQIQEAEPVDPKWWKTLGDPQLDALVQRIATENLDVLTATARLDESRSELGITAADLFPKIDADGYYTRQKLSDKGVISLVSGGGEGAASTNPAGGIPSPMKSPPFNIYQYGFDASWEIDLWGHVRRSIEAAGATVEASEEARRGMELSDIAELVSDYVQLRATQANLKLSRDSLDIAQQVAALALERAKAGLGNQLDVANAEAQTATISSQLPPLEQQQAKLMNAIALLLGQPPGALEAELSAVKPIPPIPPRVPVGLPSELARRRPDIRQAEAQLHAATAQVGVAKAEFFPQITLMGNGALQALQFKDLNTWAARSYSFGPSISLPIFEGGRLVSTLELRNTQQKEAALTYRKTVLTAFHEVDNALTAFRAEQQRRIALGNAINQNQKALKLATELYKQGLGTFLDVLTAERSLLDIQQQSITSTQTETINMVQLYKALGGGWEGDFPASKE